MSSSAGMLRGAYESVRSKATTNDEGYENWNPKALLANVLVVGASAARAGPASDGRRSEDSAVAESWRRFIAVAGCVVFGVGVVGLVGPVVRSVLVCARRLHVPGVSRGTEPVFG